MAEDSFFDVEVVDGMPKDVCRKNFTFTEKASSYSFDQEKDVFESEVESFVAEHDIYQISTHAYFEGKQYVKDIDIYYREDDD